MWDEEHENYAKCIKVIERFREDIKLLKRKNELLEEQLSEKSEDPATKKIRLTENDPFKVLNEYCIREILKNIEDGFDLYQMTKVSKLWKSFVEDDDRAADKVKKIQTLNISSYDEILEFASETRDIQYKHVTIGWCNELSLSLEKFVTPELETLSVNSFSIEWEKIQSTKYPALKELKISEDDGDGLEWVCASEFPILTDLTCIEYYERDYWERNRKIRFDSMPKLKRLHFDYGEYEDSLNQEDLADPPFHLESLTCRFYPENFCRSQAETLKNLKCNFLDFLLFENMLVTLNNLESISISIMHFRNYQHQTQFPLARNYKITKLEYESQSHLETLFQVLMSLPALETLTLYQTLTQEILDHAARVNLKLKEIICKSKPNNLVAFYENLKNAEANNVEFNKGIEIVVNSKLEWDFHNGISDEHDYDSDYKKKYYTDYESDED